MSAGGRPVLRARWLNAAQAAVAVLLAVAVNVVAVRLSARVPLSADMTANARYSLSAQTREFLSGLDGEVDIRVLARKADFESASRYTSYAATLLAQYPLHGPVTVEYVDYLRDPSFAAAYPELPLEANGLVINREGRAAFLGVGDLFEYSTLPSNEVKVTAVAEARIAAAIASVYSERRAAAGMLTGNGAKPAAELRALLEKNGYGADDVPLTSASFDPALDVLVLVAPT
ncbi:MAG TPA: Gldg family protein, partial [Candidatus Limnocylindria bacterium]|nr:Gldg family protein [Candidatus Limnocylindria bacterium]